MLASLQSAPHGGRRSDQSRHTNGPQRKHVAWSTRMVAQWHIDRPLGTPGGAHSSARQHRFPIDRRVDGQTPTAAARVGCRHPVPFPPNSSIAAPRALGHARRCGPMHRPCTLLRRRALCALARLVCLSVCLARLGAPARSAPPPRESEGVRGPPESGDADVDVQVVRLAVEALAASALCVHRLREERQVQRAQVDSRPPAGALDDHADGHEGPRHDAEPLLLALPVLDLKHQVGVCADAAPRSGHPRARGQTHSTRGPNTRRPARFPFLPATCSAPSRRRDRRRVQIATEINRTQVPYSTCRALGPYLTTINRILVSVMNEQALH
jgi:hypothetical protein